MLFNLRTEFVRYLNANYNPVPPRSRAPEVGEAIGRALCGMITDPQTVLEQEVISKCKRLANEFLKDPPDPELDFQEAFTFYQTPPTEQKIIKSIGHRRMQSPDDETMVDLINPEETSSAELFRLADKLESYGNQCIERSAYLRQLAKLRKGRGL